MSSSVALSLDISPFVAWYLDCLDTGMSDSVR